LPGIGGQLHESLFFVGGSTIVVSNIVFSLVFMLISIELEIEEGFFTVSEILIFTPDGAGTSCATGGGTIAVVS